MLGGATKREVARSETAPNAEMHRTSSCGLPVADTRNSFKPCRFREEFPGRPNKKGPPRPPIGVKIIRASRACRPRRGRVIVARQFIAGWAVNKRTFSRPGATPEKKGPSTPTSCVPPERGRPSCATYRAINHPATIRVSLRDTSFVASGEPYFSAYAPRTLPKNSHDFAPLPPWAAMVSYGKLRCVFLANRC